MWITYELTYPDGQPFYVGKGRPARPRHHLWEARRGGDSFKCRVIRKIEASGGEVGVTVLLETDSHDEAVAEEIRRIRALLDQGLVLCNHTLGGEGNVGWSPTLETRANISRSLIGRPGRPHTEETRRKISESNKGKHSIPCSLETREKLHQARKGKRPYEMTDETRRRMSESAKRRVRGPLSEETRQKMSEAAKRRWSAP